MTIAIIDSFGNPKRHLTPANFNTQMDQPHMVRRAGRDLRA
jgi:hypothetical protein